MKKPIVIPPPVTATAAPAPAKPTADERQFARAITALMEKDVLDKPLVLAMNRLFETGKWEIPDEAIVGIYAHKINQMEAQIASLTELLAQVAAKVDGEPAPATGRVDAVEAAKVKKGGK